ncbi:MAG: PTS lactose/cellobiose transporter subunit IIA [Pelolinea sp.]|jgi:PTS system cellobiose-specific IIA component|nr:PTS lactose/cellobiose transporter subunit IIA [Pelolinea sp.]
MALNKKMEEIAMQIIANAGAARSKAFEALAMAKKGDLEKAKELLKSSDRFAHEAHKSHSALLTMYANGEFDQSDLLIAHAQDHLMCAELAKELIVEIIALHEKVERR